MYKLFYYVDRTFNNKGCKRVRSRLQDVLYIHSEQALKGMKASDK